MKYTINKSVLFVFFIYLLFSINIDAQTIWNCIEDNNDENVFICKNEDNLKIILNRSDQNFSLKVLGDNFTANIETEEVKGQIKTVNEKYYTSLYIKGYATRKIEIDHKLNFIGAEIEYFYDDSTDSNYKYYRGEYKVNDQGEVIITGDGFAEMRYGGTYKGKFKDNQRNGRGEWALGNEKFVGQFENDLAISGEILYEDGSKYIGTFNGGKKHGFGEYIYLTGDRYIGAYQNNLMNGIGTYFYKNGARYEGEFFNDNFHGEGAYYYSKESALKSFVGIYKNGIPYKGIFTYSNGKPLHKGSYDNEGSLHGEGADYFYKEDGSLNGILKGNFKNGDCHGFCSELYADGSSFKGEYVNGERQGLGVLQTNYETHSGYFDQNGLQGNGIFKESKLNYEWEGPYENSKRNGQGVLTFLDDKSKYSVTFENDIYIGLEDLTLENLSTNRRLALVIGNDDYVSNPLQFAVADSLGIAGALEEVGFDVTHIINTTQEDFLNALYDFKRKILLSGKNTDVLFYYAGHASQVRGINYLNPIDSVINRESQLEIMSININRVFEVLNESVDGVKIAVLDACRNNPFASSLRSAKSGLAQMNAPPGTIIAYSTAPGETAIDGSSGGLGIYTGSLIGSIRKSDIKIEEVFKETRKTVVNMTQGQQIPWESSSLITDFYFLKED